MLGSYDDDDDDDDDDDTILSSYQQHFNFNRMRILNKIP